VRIEGAAVLTRKLHLGRDRMDKQNRHLAIKEIITKKHVSSQEELCEELKKAGFEVTQATLSRDLKELGVVRLHTSQGTRYALHETGMERTLKSFIGYEIESIAANESVILIKTHPGFASGVAEFIDSLRHPDILGTIAGDNTIMITPVSVRRIHSLMTYIKNMLKGQEVPQ
jgi:transcriptional regulator of arginine metabolism